MQGTFLSVLFVSCGFMEGAHLLRCSLGRTRSEETAPPSCILPLVDLLLCLLTLAAPCKQELLLLWPGLKHVRTVNVPSFNALTQYRETGLCYSVRA